MLLQLNNIPPDTMIHGAEAIGLALVGLIGMKIKTAQADNRKDFLEAIAVVREEQYRVKEALVASQNQIRQDLDAKHAENQAEIRAHAASDEQQFKYIGQSLGRIESKL